MCVHFHRFAPVVPAQTPRCARPARGAAALPGPPLAASACMASCSEAPLGGRQERLGPLSATGVAASASGEGGSARALLSHSLAPMPSIRAGPRGLSLAWTARGDRSPRGGGKVKHPAYKLKLGWKQASGSGNFGLLPGNFSSVWDRRTWCAVKL